MLRLTANILDPPKVPHCESIEIPRLGIDGASSLYVAPDGTLGLMDRNGDIDFLHITMASLFDPFIHNYSAVPYIY